MIVPFSYIDVAFAVEAYLMRGVELSLCRRSSVAGVSLHACSGDDRNALGLQVEPQQAMTSILHPPQRAIRSDHDPKRIVELRLVGEIAFHRHALDTRTHQCSDPAG